MYDLPPLKAVRAFEACMRLGSFTKAAGELNVGQPAISHQIQALERDLGTKLFERRGALTIPTADALLYYRSVAAGLSEMARGSASLRRSKRATSVTFATYPGIAMFWLMPRLSQIRQIDPNFNMRVTTAERDQDMPLDDVDCAILFGDGHWPNYESRLLMREIVVPVASPAIAARLAGSSRDDVLTHGPLIHLEDRAQRWFTWADWRNRRSPETLVVDSGIIVTNYGIAVHQTLMGNGIALGWLGVIDELIQNNLVVALDMEPLSSERGYYLVARAQFLSSSVGKLILRELGIA